MPNINPSTNSSSFFSSKIKKFSWNIFKNSFLLPIFSIGLIGGSSYLFYTGQTETGAALAGTAVAAITANNKDDKDEKEADERSRSIQIDELQEEVKAYRLLNQENLEKSFDYQIKLAVAEERLRNIEAYNEREKELEKKLLEQSIKAALSEQKLTLLQPGSQQFNLPESTSSSFTPTDGKNITELQNPPDDLNIK